MLNNKTKSILLSLVTATSLFLVGCGSSDTNPETYSAETSISGQLIDSYVQGASYHCEDGSDGLTGLLASLYR